MAKALPIAADNTAMTTILSAVAYVLLSVLWGLIALAVL